MRVVKLVSLISMISMGAVAFGQTLPPPDFAGQSYWFGPGPSAMSLQSSSQDTGGWAELTNNGATWAVGGSGGPALVSTSATPTSANAVFSVPTSVNIQPYIYIDGYFGLTASISGFGAGDVNLGSSRFYVIHNVPVQVTGFGFGDLVGPGPTTLQASYLVTYTSYTQPTVTDNFTFPGGASGSVSLNLDPTTDEGISFVDIQRTVSVTAQAQGGAYTASGSVMVSTL